MVRLTNRPDGVHIDDQYLWLDPVGGSRVSPDNGAAAVARRSTVLGAEDLDWTARLITA
jgi:hypothetical protein